MRLAATPVNVNHTKTHCRAIVRNGQSPSHAKHNRLRSAIVLGKAFWSYWNSLSGISIRNLQNCWQMLCKQPSNLRIRAIPWQIRPYGLLMSVPRNNRGTFNGKNDRGKDLTFDRLGDCFPDSISFYGNFLTRSMVWFHQISYLWSIFPRHFKGISSLWKSFAFWFSFWSRGRGISSDSESEEDVTGYLSAEFPSW
jgi:hypothetical protein